MFKEHYPTKKVQNGCKPNTFSIVVLYESADSMQNDAAKHIAARRKA